MVIIENGKIPGTGEKSKAEYGAKCAEKMWTGYKHGGISIGYNNVLNDAQLDSLAQGRQSQDDMNTMQRFLGSRNNSTLDSIGFKSMDLQLVNIMPKYINIMQDKLMSIKYDIGVDVIDQTSMDEKKQVEQTLNAYVKLKDNFAKIGVQFDKIKEETGIDELPDTAEDVKMLMSTSYKHYDAMRSEIELLKLHNVSDWDSIMAKVSWDLLVRGCAGVRTYVDNYGNIKEEWLPMHRFVCSFAQTEDFNNLQYAGHIEYLTLDEFICDSKGYIPVDEAIVLFNTHKGNYFGNGEEVVYPGSVTNEIDAKIKVFRFQYLTEDIEKYTKELDEAGNVLTKKQKSSFVVSETEKPLYSAGRKSLVEISEAAKYGGNWIVGSKKCYDYGLIQKGDGLILDYHVFAPNMRNGRVVSMASQLREVTMMLSVAWTRYKEGIGKGFFGQLEINIDLLVDKMPIKGGKNLNWTDVIDLFMMNGISLAKGKRNQHDQNVGRALDVLNEGVGANDFINTINLCKELIRDICGVNELADGSTPKAGTLVGVTEAANRGTNSALSPYYRAYHSIKKRASIAMLGYWKSIPSNDVWLRDFVIGLDAATTEEEWALYNNKLAELTRIPLEQGGLTTSDYFDLMYPNVKNLKQAQALCKIRVGKNMKTAQAKAEQMSTMNNQQQLAVAQASEQARADTLKLEYQLKAQFEQSLTFEIIKRQDEVNKGLFAAKQLEMQGRQSVVDRQGADSIIKHSMISQSDQAVQDMKSQVELIKKQHDLRMHDLEMMLKQQEIQNSKEEKSEAA